MTKRVRFLSADQIIEIHRVLIERWGGSAGGGHRGAGYEGVDAAVQAVKNSYYETREELAAAHSGDAEHPDRLIVNAQIGAS